MAGQSSGDLLQQTVDQFAQRVSDYADGIANRLGTPLSGQQLTRDEAVQRWNFSPLGSTQAADAQYHTLVAQGMPPGQALDQVYPMRSMLYRGASIQDSIATAKQIQGWAADATGVPAPEPPKTSTLPMLMAMQHGAGAQLPAPPAAPPLSALQSPPGPVAPPVAPPMPGPMPGPPPPMPPGPMPPPMPGMS